MPRQLSIKVEQNVAITMRDGVVTHADVYRPEGSGKYPTLLTRTPYCKDDYNTRVGEMDPIRAASEGYAVVIQDVRGRYTSEGEFYTFKNETNDGYDSIEWIAAQDWSTGKVGMYGGSYVGATQWLAGISSPPHLTTIIPDITASEYREGWTYQGGAFQLNFALNWTLSLVQSNIEALSRRLGDLTEENARISRDLDSYNDAVQFLPLKEYPSLLRDGLAPYYFDWVEHPNDDDYWQAWKISDRYEDVEVPAFHIGCWYDIFLGGTLKNFAGMQKNGGAPEARNGQKLIIGPWIHMAKGSKTASVDYGVNADSRKIDLHGMKLRWFDHWLKGIDNGIMEEPPVRIFVMGVNEWRDENEWPLARTSYTDYYLRSGGNANTINGDGVLSTQAPGDEQGDTFLYNPSNPVPTTGGPLCCFESPFPSGAYDQRETEARSDVLVYSTPPLEEDTEVTGPVTVTLWAASSAPDTDFTAKLVDVCPCGGAVNLTDGIIRASYRESHRHPTPITPGQVYEYNIDLWATSNTFKAGHRIRLDVSSSNFPRFDRNPNTGNGFGEDKEVTPAMQSIFHSSRYPSCVTLPIIPR